MDQKWFLQSKTIIGVLIMLLVQLAPLLGFQFTNEDGQQVVAHLDAILTAIGALIAIWGRFTAKEPVTLFRSNRTHSPWPVALVALLLVVACENQPSGTPKTVQQTYYALKASYTVALEEAADYAALPFCTDVVLVGCAKPDIVVKLDEAADEASKAFDQADMAFAAINENPLEQATALDAATVALRQLTAILALTIVAENAK